MHVRYDLETDRVDPGYPKAIGDGWFRPCGTGFDLRVGAALDLGAGEVYWFGVGAYLRLSQQWNAVDQGPSRSPGTGLGSPRRDSTPSTPLCWGNGKAYLFRAGLRPLRHHHRPRRPWLPPSIAGTWPGWPRRDSTPSTPP